MPMVHHLVRVSFLSTVVLAQGPPAEAWQVLRALEVRGAPSLTRQQVQWALAWDPETMRALQRPLDAATAHDLAERLQQALCGAGFTSARVDAKAIDGVLRLDIEEGPRRRCGAIVVTGTSALDAAAMRAGLRGAGRNWRGWRDGEFAPADAGTLPRIVELVREHAKGLGRHGLRATASFRDAEDTVELRIEIADEGHEVRVRRLALDGEDAANEPAALAFVGWPADRLLTSAALDELRDRLRSCGRYATVEPEPGNDPPAVLDPLVVRVRVIDGAPGFADPASADLRQLQAGLDHLRVRLARGGHLQLDVELRDPVSWGPNAVLPGHGGLRMGPGGLLLAIERLALGGGEAAPLHVALSATSLVVRHGDRWGRTSFADSLGVQFQLTSSVTGEGDPEMRWGFGVSTTGADLCRIDFDPRTANAMLHSATVRPRREGQDLLATVGSATVRLGPDGALRTNPLSIPGEEVSGSLTVHDQGVAAEIAAVEATAPRRSTWSAPGLLLDLLTPIAEHELAARGAGAPTGAALLRGIGVAMRTAKVDAEPPRTASLVIRSRGGAEARPTDVFVSLLGGLAAVTPGWPATVLGSAGSFVGGRQRAALATVLALADEPTTGPIALLAIAWAFALIDEDKVVTALRDRARERWSFDAAFADLQPLLAPGSTLGELGRAIGAQWRQQPELTDLCAGLPAGGEGDLAALRRGLSELWDAGLGQSLRELLLPDGKH